MTDDELILAVKAVIGHNDNQSKRRAAEAALTVAIPEIQRRLIRQLWERFAGYPTSLGTGACSEIYVAAKEWGIDAFTKEKEKP